MALGFIKELVGPVTGLVSEFIEDKDQANKLAHEIATLAEKQAHQQIMAQVDVNKQEAAHKSLFVAGWRPFVGWTCGVALAYHFVLSPVLAYILVLAGIDTPMPEFEFSQLSTILMGMLGLGGLRSYEKMKGVQRDR